MKPDNAPELDFWYLGYRRDSSRRLEDGERNQLRRECIACGIAAALLGIGTPILLVLTLGGVLVVSDQWQYNSWDTLGATIKTIRGLLLMGLSMAAFGVVVLLALAMKLLGQRSNGLRKDLAAGFINQYSVQGHTVEILPCSNRIWRVDDEEQSWFQGPAQQEQLAAPPRGITRVQMPVSDAEIKEFLSDSPKRPLSDAEHAELRRLVRKDLVILIFGPLVLSGYFGSVLIYATVSSNIGTKWIGWLGLALFGYKAYRSTEAIKATVQAHAALRRDARKAVVGEEPTGPHRLEVLPESRQIWTIDGEPATWRRKTSI